MVKYIHKPRYLFELRGKVQHHYDPNSWHILKDGFLLRDLDWHLWILVIVFAKVQFWVGQSSMAEATRAYMKFSSLFKVADWWAMITRLLYCEILDKYIAWNSSPKLSSIQGELKAPKSTSSDDSVTGSSKRISRFCSRPKITGATYPHLLALNHWTSFFKKTFINRFVYIHNNNNFFLFFSYIYSIIY